MNTRKVIKPLTVSDKNVMLSKSFYALPDNPSDKNFSASQIRKKGYEGLIYLFDIITGLIADINDNSELTDQDVSALNILTGSIADFITGAFTGAIANNANADGSGNNIAQTYETKTDATAKLTTALTQLGNLITALNNGTAIPARAKADEGGNNIKSSYFAGVTEIAGSKSATFQKKYFKFLNKMSEQIGLLVVDLQTATTSYAGLLSAVDKLKIDNIASDIATALAQAKTYTDNHVARSSLVSTLGEASTSLNGLMSNEDKRRLDVLYALLGESSDVDTVVNTISEVLAIFSQYPEGVSIVTALADKVNFGDIVDNLESYNSLKVLSANQGRIIKGLIDNIVNGTTVVKKAQQDKNGNDIDTTYYSKGEYFPVMAVSISEPDPITGEVTIDYPSGMTLSFNDTTGEVTFSW